MAALPKLSTLFAGYLGQIFNTTFSVGKFIVQFVLAFIICFYILLEKEDFLLFTKKTIYVMFGKKYGDFTLEVCSTLNSNIGKYFSGKILDSFIVGVLSGIGLYFIKSQYALLFGILIGFMNLIPYFWSRYWNDSSCFNKLILRSNYSDFISYIFVASSTNRSCSYRT